MFGLAPKRGEPPPGEEKGLYAMGAAGPSRREGVRRSLPGAITAEGMLPDDDDLGRECLSLGNSPQPLDELEEDEQPQQQPEKQER
ncbi:unnamed protein product, partial [Scytosiphon promiscuus]